MFVVRFPLEPDIVRTGGPQQGKGFNELSTSPKGECWKISAELNSKTGAQSGLMDADASGPEPMAGNKSEVLVTPAQLDVGTVCGSSAAESAASVAGLSFPSSDEAVRSGSRARAVTGAISCVWPDDRSSHVLKPVEDQVSTDIGHKI